MAGVLPAEPEPRPADQAIVDALDRVPIVAFAESHGSVRQHAFLRRLLLHPSFAARIDDVVVEFGNARYQGTVDRYVAGRDVAPGALRRVWERTTQTSGVWNAPMYRAFFATVRAVNRRLAPSERIRVLLGDPPIDWSEIRASSCPEPLGPQCLDYWIGRRNAHYASVVLDKVLARGRRALLVAGAFHLVRRGGSEHGNETALIERRCPGSVVVVLPHQSLHGPSSARLQRKLSRWPVGSLAPVRGTWLGALDPDVVFGGEDADRSRSARGRLEDLVDYYLYLG